MTTVRRTKTLMTGVMKGKRVVYVCSLISVFLLAVGAISARQLILEEWYLWNLQSGDVQSRTIAAGHLGQMGSSRSVPFLIHAAVSDNVLGVREAAIGALFQLKADVLTTGISSGMLKSTIKEEECVKVLSGPFLRVFKDLGIKDYPEEPKTFVDLLRLKRFMDDVTKSIGKD